LYEVSDRVRGLAAAGIGAMHRLVQHVGLVRDLNEHVKVLKRHQPYYESDHVLTIAYNVLCGGQRLEDIELRRQDEVHLDALGAERIPDPTTAGDFCRRFDHLEKVESLQNAINESRLRVWQQQPREFFEEAVIDADGTLVPTKGECKEGADFNYKGEWGYHVLVVSLANTQEPLFLDNRPGNRPSSEGAAARFDQALELCRRAGFRWVTFRGDTDFSQTQHLDRWDDDGVRFVFGFDAKPQVIRLADGLTSGSWTPLERRQRATATRPRRRRTNVKKAKVIERKYNNIRLNDEDVAEFAYSPTSCRRTYRMIVVRKNLTTSKGDARLFDHVRYFFYLTNDTAAPAWEIVAEANQRCRQEQLISQLHSGVRATSMPLDSLLSNWAYMVMAALAWSLKAWFALLLPERGRWDRRRRLEKLTILNMEFRTFLNAFMLVPAQLVRTGRRTILRLLGWNCWQEVFLRGLDQLHGTLRC